MDIENGISIIVFIVFIGSVAFTAVFALGPLIRRLQPPSQRLIAERMMMDEIARQRVENIELGRVISEWATLNYRLLEQLGSLGVEPVAKPNGIIRAAERGEKPLVVLHRMIKEFFSSEEMNVLALEVGIHHEDLGGDTRSERALSLVDYCERHGLLQELVAACARLRPSERWPKIP